MVVKNLLIFLLIIAACNITITISCTNTEADQATTSATKSQLAEQKEETEFNTKLDEHLHQPPKKSIKPGNAFGLRKKIGIVTTVALSTFLLTLEELFLGGLRFEYNRHYHRYWGKKREQLHGEAFCDEKEKVLGINIVEVNNNQLQVEYDEDYYQNNKSYQDIKSFESTIKSGHKIVGIISNCWGRQCFCIKNESGKIVACGSGWSDPKDGSRQWNPIKITTCRVLDSYDIELKNNAIPKMSSIKRTLNQKELLITQEQQKRLLSSGICSATEDCTKSELEKYPSSLIFLSEKSYESLTESLKQTVQNNQELGSFAKLFWTDKEKSQAIALNLFIKTIPPEKRKNTEIIIL